MPSIHKLVKEKDMSKKTLLEEGTIRRFMKLAEMGPIGDSFVSNMFNEEEEPAPPEEAGFDETEFGADEELDAELEGEDEMLDVDDDVLDDDGGDLDAGTDGELTLTDEEADAFLAVADRIRAALEGAPAPEDIPAPDMGVEDEGEEELDAELDTGEEELDAGEEELDVDVEDEELVQERSSVVNESLVNQIVKRVAKRLTKKRK